MVSKQQPGKPEESASAEQASCLEKVAKMVGQTGEGVTHTTSQTGKALADTVAGVGGAIANSTTNTVKAIATTISDLAEAAVKQTHQWIEQATQDAGQAVTSLGDNTWLRTVSGFLKLDWIFNASERVDLEKAQIAVQKLQQQYPNESSSQIAHRIIVDKAIYAGGVGFVTSLIPGGALGLLAVDLATTSVLQAEMVYQIASIYGLDLKDSARKGEILAIFGLALGGGRAVKLGLGLLRNLPFAGAAIGASSNAVMFYSLGYAACRFYEGKLNSTSQQITVQEFQAQSEEYLEKAITQQAIVDQILVHTILAIYPEKSWSEILPQLQTLNFSPTSLETISAHIKSPLPIDTLLNQLNRDYAMMLLAQCYRITQSQKASTPLADNLLRKIATKFNIDLNDIKKVVLAGDRNSSVKSNLT